MRIYLNELAFDGTFSSRDAVEKCFKGLIGARRRSPALRQALYCSVMLKDRRAYGNELLSTTILTFSRDERLAVLQWLNRFGPFQEMERELEENDFFSFEGVDVTDQGLGEAARRVLHDQSAAVHSPASGGRINFERTPLTVVHGLDEEPYGKLHIDNSWTIEGLIKQAEGSQEEPESWGELLRQCRLRFEKLIIGPACDGYLASHPYRPAVGRRVVELCRILQSVMDNMHADGSLTSDGEQIRQTHFVGDNSLFSDESDGNKKEFANEMTFPDPSDASKSLTCFWHGKINSPKYRLHFEWPVKHPRTALKIAYIGPKISKR
jgi:hypothetical protein